ncbi:hypothetical protein NK553_14625 [Pseudomonas sp. ZM23]|uniref:Uncharacterized protein n=1 Tax=Pseudomonas triclosanedens TaxID=2961893 RepID=A0ABY6ZYH9_9PSED|nr:hypothetical protein [Pseudomonas triclosanedens]MCP8465184.1 hypothetical protein [Pseudomonas triclosanedens]MCP8470876.1 hypothetical protein [Pseudomonas triclosanedens]MCP8476555.1 hypothetical protein [Pseudomonas triclosanedens]WAI49060.1 hypothetical protein OU419_25475 [Pseudomonas triclosanedens]
MWVQIAILVASYILQRALAPKPKQPKATAFADIDFPLCKEGEEITAVFGQKWTKSWMVLTVGNYRTKPIRVKGSKK